MNGKFEVEVEAKLTVSRETAEACLRLVSLFINENNNFMVRSTTSEKEDGTISLCLVDCSGADDAPEPHKGVSDCSTCKHAIVDYDYSENEHTSWFISGCDIGGDPDDCEDYEENET